MEVQGTIHYQSACGHWVSEPLMWQMVVPLRGEDYPVLARIWENEDDDNIFADDAEFTA